MHDLETAKRQILDRVDILEVVSDHVRLKRSGQRWVGLCPFHSEKTPSFTVRPDHGSFKCFGCGKGGDVFSFIQLRENVSFMESMSILADRVGIELSQRRRSGSTEPGRADLAKVSAWAAGFFRTQLLDPDLGRSAREYLQHRQMTSEITERFQLGLALDGGDRLQRAASQKGIDRSLLLAADLLRKSERGNFYDTFRNRLVFPIRDATGRIIGFGGRTLGEDRAKYINTAQNALFDKGRNLYGIDLARKALTERRRAIVVEGYTDCLAAHQAGFTETVATLGTALTEAQVRLMRRYCEEIILLFDSDQAGEAAAERAIRVALPQCVTVRLAHIPDGQDPSDFLSHASSDAFSDVLNKSVDALEFKWSQVRKRYEGGASNTRRREAILDFLRVVAEGAEASAVDAIQRGLLINQVAHLIRADRDEVDRMMRRLTPRRSDGRTRETGGAMPPPHVGPSDGEQAAWTRVLEVLLSEPTALRSVDDVPNIARITDERDRRIAQVVFELAGGPEGFTLADVLARCHDTADVERVTEVARRGARLNRREATLQSAFDRIAEALQHEKLEQCKQGLLRPETEQDTDVDGTDVRETIQEGAKKHKHFVPRRLIRQSLGEQG